jgi:hypothetical protein
MTAQESLAGSPGNLPPQPSELMDDGSKHRKVIEAERS